MERRSAVEGVIAASLVAVGFAACAPVTAVVGTLSGVGANWATNLAAGAYRRWSEGWLTERGALNGHLRRAMGRALKATLADVGSAYENSEAYRDLRRRDPDAARSELEQLTDLGRQGEQWFDDEAQLRAIVRDRAEPLLRSAYDPAAAAAPDRAEPRRALLAALQGWSAGRSPGLAEFVERYLTQERVDELSLRFFEELKKDDAEGTAAWRAWQLLQQESTEAALAEVRRQAASTGEAVARIEQMVGELQAWGRALASTPPGRPHPLGRDLLPDSVARLEGQLADFRDRLSALAGRMAEEHRQQQQTLDGVAADIRDLKGMLAGALAAAPAARPLPQPLTWQQLQRVAAGVFRRRMPKASGEHFDARVYLPRPAVREPFDAFLAAEEPGFILIGKSGVGKTNFLASLFHEQQTNGRLALLMYAASQFDRPQDEISEMLGEDAAWALEVDGPLDFWKEIRRIEGLGKDDRRLVLCIDALDENPVSPEKLLAQIDELVCGARWPWLKIVVTCRTESWRVITRKVELSAAHYHRLARREFGSPMDWLPCSAEMQPFARDESEAAYALYRSRPSYGRLPEYNSLPPETQDALRDPLLLRLVADISQSVQVSGLTARKIISEYVGHLVKTRRLAAEDVAYVREQLLPQMIRLDLPDETARFRNELYVPAASPPAPVVHLANAEILLLRARPDYPDQQVARFKYERFWDHFAGRFLDEQFPRAAGPAAEALSAVIRAIQNRPQHAFMLGALVNALLCVLERPATADPGGVFLELSGRELADCRDLAATALEEFGRGAAGAERARLLQVLRLIYGGGAARASPVTRERRALSAVRIAGSVGATDVLEDAVAARSPVLRDRATVSAYYLWCRDHVAGFALLERMLAPIQTGTLPGTLIRRRALISSCARLSALIFFRHHGDPEVPRWMSDHMRPLIRRLLLYNPQAVRREPFLRPVREGLIRFAIWVVRAVEHEVPTRMNLQNFQELSLYYDLPRAVHEHAAQLIPLLDPTHQDLPRLVALMEEQFAFDQVNSPLLKLLSDYALVAQGLQRFVDGAEGEPAPAGWDDAAHEVHLHAVLDLAGGLTRQELAAARPGSAHWLQWDKTWVFAALALLEDRISDRFFDDFTALVRDVSLAGPWRGPLVQHSYAPCTAYALMASKHRPGETAMLRELCTEGVQRRDNRLLLDILEEMSNLVNTEHGDVALRAIEPLLTYDPAPSQAGDLAPALQARLVEVLAMVYQRDPYRVDRLFERLLAAANAAEQTHLEALRSQVRVKKIDERIVADLMKGGMGPWAQFILRYAVSRQGNPFLVWAFSRAVQVDSFNRLLFEVSRKTINLVSGADIFPIRDTRGTAA